MVRDTGIFNRENGKLPCIPSILYALIISEYYLKYNIADTTYFNLAFVMLLLTPISEPSKPNILIFYFSKKNKHSFLSCRGF